MPHQEAPIPQTNRFTFWFLLILLLPLSRILRSLNNFLIEQFLYDISSEEKGFIFLALLVLAIYASLYFLHKIRINYQVSNQKLLGYSIIGLLIFHYRNNYGWKFILDDYPIKIIDLFFIPVFFYWIIYLKNTGYFDLFSSPDRSAPRPNSPYLQGLALGSPRETWIEIKEFGKDLEAFCWAETQVASQAIDHRLTHYFLGDAPIHSNQDDLLDRSESAATFAQQIISLPLNPSFAIGFVGAWGSGKTSFLNLIKEKIREIQSDKILITQYNPWSRQEDYRISQHFFSLLAKLCAPYSDPLARLLPRYRNQLANRYRAQPGNLSYLLRSYYQPNESYQELFVKINQAFAQLNFKIIIFIDDIDRLPKAEVIELLTLIYKTARFQNICFLSAYDKQYIVKAIESQSEYNADYFLEKVFQMEYHLPKISRSFLKTSLLDSLSKRMEQANLSELQGIIFPQKEVSKLEEDFTLGYLENLRDVYRFSNSLSFNYRNVAGQVELDDFFRVELIKLKFPEVYRLLFHDKDKFLVKNEQPTGSAYMLKRNNYSGHFQFQDYLEAHSPEYNLQPNEIQNLCRTAEKLFIPSYDAVLQLKSFAIARPAYFANYFTSLY